MTEIRAIPIVGVAEADAWAASGRIIDGELTVSPEQFVQMRSECINPWRSADENAWHALRIAGVCEAEIRAHMGVPIKVTVASTATKANAA